jgi:tRNA(His) 5'-end guanylyltransferase
MNTSLLERLRGFQIPPATPLHSGNHVVARLQGIDFEAMLDSPSFGFSRPFDANFGKMMIRTASHCLGGDACGRFAFIESMEISVLLDRESLGSRWRDATDLQSYLVALSSSKMSLQVEDEALFACKLYSFSKVDLVTAYFLWRRQEAALLALDRYCGHVLSKDGSSAEHVAAVLEGLGPLEKEEILRENHIEYGELPAWQRSGAAVYLPDGQDRVIVDTSLPRESEYGAYLQQHLG